MFKYVFLIKHSVIIQVIKVLHLFLLTLNFGRQIGVFLLNCYGLITNPGTCTFFHENFTDIIEFFHIDFVIINVLRKFLLMNSKRQLLVTNKCFIIKYYLYDIIDIFGQVFVGIQFVLELS